jgi:RNA polymerase sporulation-specific sigma factor
MKKRRDKMGRKHTRLPEAIKSLNTKEKDIINMRYYQARHRSKSEAEIAISQAQFSRIENIRRSTRIKRQI